MQIPLRKGGFTIVDDQDASLALAFNWRRHEDKRTPGRTEYAAFTILKAGKVKLLLLHRLIMQAQDGERIDHIDGNGLNNSRSNLRRCTQSQNRANGRQWKIPPSGFRGVYQRGAKWFSAISTGGRSLSYLGTFTSKEDAARAYDAAAFEKWGEFARLNFPKNGLAQMTPPTC